MLGRYDALVACMNEISEAASVVETTYATLQKDHKLPSICVDPGRINWPLVTEAGEVLSQQESFPITVYAKLEGREVSDAIAELKTIGSAWVNKIGEVFGFGKIRVESMEVLPLNFGTGAEIALAFTSILTIN